MEQLSDDDDDIIADVRGCFVAVAFVTMLSGKVHKDSAVGLKACFNCGIFSHVIFSFRFSTSSIDE